MQKVECLEEQELLKETETIYVTLPLSMDDKSLNPALERYSECTHTATFLWCSQ